MNEKETTAALKEMSIRIVQQECEMRRMKKRIAHLELHCTHGRKE